MMFKPLLMGVMSIGALAGVAGCGGSTAPTPTPSTGGLTLPSFPGFGSGSTGSAPAADKLLSASDVQSISGDSNVSALTAACTSSTCIYSDTTGSGGGGVIFVQPFPGVIGTAALQGAIAAALSGQAASSGGTATAVSGLGSGAIKEIDTNSATYAFVKDNYLVVINVTSGTKTGAEMDSQVGAAAQTVAGSL